MRTLLHALRVICYLCAFVSLFNASILLGYTGSDFIAFLIDLGMAAFFALIGLVFSYLRTYVVKRQSSENNNE